MPVDISSVTTATVREIESHGYLLQWQDTADAAVLRAVSVMGDDRGQWFKATGDTRLAAAVAMAGLLGFGDVGGLFGAE